MTTATTLDAARVRLRASLDAVRYRIAHTDALSALEVQQLRELLPELISDAATLEVLLPPAVALPDAEREVVQATMAGMD